MRKVQEKQFTHMFELLISRSWFCLILPINGINEHLLLTTTCHINWIHEQTVQRNPIVYSE